jgi:GNAT superfamily N-acetyltransferase
MSATLQTHIATEANYDSILSLTNDAFMADAFFKKAEYHLRFDRPTVKSMMAAPNSRFILAAQTNDNSKIPCGSLFLHWEVTTTDTETRVRICHQVSIFYRSLQCPVLHILTQVTGKFSAVSVPAQFEKRGIGKALVKAAEEQLMEIAKNEHAIRPNSDLAISMEMGVINQRKDLFPWYEGQGYKLIGEIRPNDAELLRICLDDIDICCILMRKCLL